MVQTRMLYHADGKREIVRILSNEELAEWKAEDPLSYEKSIVWLEDVEQLPFVRVVEVRCAKSRRGRLSLHGRERLVGYSKLMADAPRDPNTARFTRRLFYLKPEDSPSSTVPNEHAVIPKTVLPGCRGETA